MVEEPSSGFTGSPHRHPLLPGDLQALYRELGYWEGKVLYEFVENWAGQDPDRLAVTGDEPMTYGDLWRRANALAAALQARGLVAGDTLLAVLPSGWRGMVLTVAASLSGLLLVPRSHRISPALATNLVEQLNVSALVIWAPLMSEPAWSKAHERCGIDKKLAFATEGHVDGLVDFEPLLETGASPAVVAPEPLAPAIVLSTGGSTGTPKSIVHGSEGLVFAARNFARVTGYSESDVHVAIAPYGHAGGSIFEIYMPLIFGARVLPVPAWRPADVASLIERYKGTYFLSMGTHIYDLLELGEAGAQQLRSMRLAATGAGSDKLFLTGEEKLGFTLLRMYGFSEAPGHAIGVLGEARTTRLRRDGVPFDGMEIRIEPTPTRDERFVRAGSYSCRGPNLFMGYAGQPQLTREVVTDDGFYSPGDVIGEDSDGYLTWLGRTKDVIRRGGLQIDPIELENLLDLHPNIGEAVVVGVPDDRLGERAAIVAMGSDSPRPELADLCAHLLDAGIGRQSLPERLFWVQTLRRTELGKLDRAAIRREILERAPDDQ